MRALTLWPEWAVAVAHLGKDVENRKWAPTASHFGTRIAIHSGIEIGGRTGKARTAEGLASLTQTAYHAKRPVESEQIEDTQEYRVRLRLPTQRGASFPWRPIVRGAIIATVQLDGVTDVRDHTGPIPPWAHPDSPFWWHLSDVYVLPTPIPWKGCLGLWRVDPTITAKLRRVGA